MEASHSDLTTATLFDHMDVISDERLSLYAATLRVRSPMVVDMYFLTPLLEHVDRIPHALFRKTLKRGWSLARGFRAWPGEFSGNPLFRQYCPAAPRLLGQRCLCPTQNPDA